jgi:hypothetical protein
MEVFKIVERDTRLQTTRNEDTRKELGAGIAQ